MFRVVQAEYVDLEKKLESCEDPLILDIRNERDMRLSQHWGKDYVHVRNLANRGITEVILRNEIRGIRQYDEALKKCMAFERELVMLYDDKRHMKYVTGAINERSKVV